MADGEFRSLLTRRLADVEDLLERLGDDERSILLDRADATADDEHDPEGSTLSAEWSRLDALRRAAVAERTELQAALARVEAGEYGVCVNCGRGIPRDRLRVRPMATLCVDCAR